MRGFVFESDPLHFAGDQETHAHSLRRLCCCAPSANLIVRARGAHLHLTPLDNIDSQAGWIKPLWPLGELDWRHRPDWGHSEVGHRAEKLMCSALIPERGRSNPSLMACRLPICRLITRHMRLHASDGRC